MRLYLFPNPYQSDNNSEDKQILQQVADGTDTSDLVVALYLGPEQFRTRGTAYVHRWITPDKFLPSHGSWKDIRTFGTPSDLPEQFKLIRLRMNMDRRSYPKKETDIYGWQFHYPDFKTHLAHLFAHELHHFRRYHLGLHPREGEHRANQWAVDHTQKLGYSLEFRRMKKRSRKGPSFKDALIKKIIPDPFHDFRQLDKNDRVRIITDPRATYQGQSARVLRPIRANSRRIVIQTQDGKDWRWPMAWLEPVNQTTKI